MDRSTSPVRRTGSGGATGAGARRRQGELLRAEKAQREALCTEERSEWAGCRQRHVSFLQAAERSANRRRRAGYQWPHPQETPSPPQSPPPQKTNSRRRTRSAEASRTPSRPRDAAVQQDVTPTPPPSMHPRAISPARGNRSPRKSPRSPTTDSAAYEAADLRIRVEGRARLAMERECERLRSLVTVWRDRAERAEEAAASELQLLRDQLTRRDAIISQLQRELRLVEDVRREAAALSAKVRGSSAEPRSSALQEQVAALRADRDELKREAAEAGEERDEALRSLEVERRRSQVLEGELRKAREYAEATAVVAERMREEAAAVSREARQVALEALGGAGGVEA
eukprot:Hpha_TRINITY_DN18607_c0_g1::TRINITY_DN18607_c0_g1_i1::g.115758::m.115758